MSDSSGCDGWMNGRLVWDSDCESDGKYSVYMGVMGSDGTVEGWLIYGVSKWVVGCWMWVRGSDFMTGPTYSYCHSSSLRSSSSTPISLPLQFSASSLITLSPGSLFYSLSLPSSHCFSSPHLSSSIAPSS